jgi:hypothetical protein
MGNYHEKDVYKNYAEKRKMTLIPLSGKVTSLLSAQAVDD